MGIGFTINPDALAKLLAGENDQDINVDEVIIVDEPEVPAPVLAHLTRPPAQPEARIVPPPQPIVRMPDGAEIVERKGWVAPKPLRPAVMSDAELLRATGEDRELHEQDALALDLTAQDEGQLALIQAEQARLQARLREMEQDVELKKLASAMHHRSVLEQAEALIEAQPELPPDPAPTPAEDAKAVADLIAYLNTQFVGRQELIMLTMVAFVAHHHLIVIGPRGAAKSQVFDFATKALTGARVGGIQGNAYVTPDELVGSYSLPKLEQGVYERDLTGRIGDSHYYVLDEGMKLTNRAFNTLLRVLNEREVYNPAPTPVPLRACLISDNDYTMDDELAPLRDRLTLRTFVTYVTADETVQLLKLVQDRGPRVRIDAEVFERMHALSKAVAIPDDVLDALVWVRGELLNQRVEVSDRRMRWSLDILRAVAVLAGRDHVQASDLPILNSVLWDNPDHRDAVSRVIAAAVERGVDRVKEARETLESVVEAWNKFLGTNPTVKARSDQRAEMLMKLRDLAAQAKQLVDKAAVQKTLDEATALAEAVRQARDMIANQRTVVGDQATHTSSTN